MANTETLERTRQDVAQNVGQQQIDQLQQEAARNLVTIKTEVLKSPHFHLWQAIKQSAATGDIASIYIVDMVRFGQGLRVRELLPVEDYFSSMQRQSSNSNGGNGSAQQSDARYGAPSRESISGR